MHENQICNYIKSLFVVLQQYPLLSFHFEEAMNENTYCSLSMVGLCQSANPQFMNSTVCYCT